MTEPLIDLLFVATNKVSFDVLLNDNKLLDTYVFQNEFGLGSAYIDTYENLNRMMVFLFHANAVLTELTSQDNKKVFDLTSFKESCMSIEDLDKKYPEWIGFSGRENTMDEYGNLLGIISYVRNNISKTKLILVTEQRNQ